MNNLSDFLGSPQSIYSLTVQRRVGLFEVSLELDANYKKAISNSSSD